MLVMALAATLVGFGLLVVALVTGTLWLAIACIVVCIVGGVFLLADLLGLGRAITLRRTPTRSAGGDTDDAEPGVEDPQPQPSTTETPDSEVSDTGVTDTEVTTEFPRVPADEPVVSLDDTETAEPVRHGRHESSDAPHGPSRPPRHGAPEL